LDEADLRMAVDPFMVLDGVAEEAGLSPLLQPSTL